MREKYRKSIASLNKFPQFTTMNVIDGQAGLISYTSLIFYSLTIDNILNIIVLLILAGVTIGTLTGENGILTQADKAKTETNEKGALEAVQLEAAGSFDNQGNYSSSLAKANLEKNLNAVVTENSDRTLSVKYKGYDFIVDVNGKVVKDTLGARISATDYGDYINYNVDLNNDGDTTNDWRVFYNDGENVFIIAADYVPTTVLGETGVDIRGDYSIGFNSSYSKSIDYNVASLFKYTYNIDYDKSGKLAAVSNMLDSTAWRVFASGKENAVAIGGSTLEMFILSWNEKGYTPLYYNIDNGGYYVGTSESPTTHYTDLENDSVGYEDTLYFPHHECSGSYGYYLTSPVVTNMHWLNYVSCFGEVR